MLIIIDKEGNQIAEPAEISAQIIESIINFYGLHLEYLEGPGVYKVIDNIYFDETGWIDKP